VAAELDLLGQQRLTGAAVFGTLIGKANAAGAGDSRCSFSPNDSSLAAITLPPSQREARSAAVSGARVGSLPGTTAS